MRRLLAFTLLLLPFFFSSAHAQSWGTVEGLVSVNPTGETLAGVTVLVAGTDFGTASGSDGKFSLRLPSGRYALRFSIIGFETQTDSVVVTRDRITAHSVRLSPARIELGDVIVEERGAASDAGVYQIDPEQIKDIPAPFRDVFRALKVMPGVAANNEMSNQYSVRGGGFNENLIFLNGFEVFMPFRPRQGEQEGLGILNPDMADQVTFYSGGFPARYGGKLSSALDVTYRPPSSEAVHGSGYVSLLDAGVTAGASPFNGRLGWIAGFRKAQAQRFFSTQELKGTYQPDYTDLQAMLSFKIAPGHTLDAIGIWADHDFMLDPSSRKTYFGTISLDPERASDFRSLWLSFSGDSEEKDGYKTRFGGVRLSDRLSDRLRMEHDIAVYSTAETEKMFLSGKADLYQVDPNSGDPESGGGHVAIGQGTQEDRADNRVAVQTLTGQGRWLFTTGRHAAEGGWYARGLQFDDRIFETSFIIGKDEMGEISRLKVDSLNDASVLRTAQGGLYIQDAVDLLPERNKFILSGGLRADYFSFSDEWTLSPRLNARYRLSEATTLLGSAGIYYQAPTYRELRGQPGSSIAGSLNRGIRSQRSIQVVAGAERFLPKRRLYLRGEAYWKELSNIISYDVRNVRVIYSGVNDADGRVYGADFQVRGQFVPGLESWANYSYMVARERFLPEYQTKYNHSTVPRPTDQRHTFSLFLQDYIPGDPTWRIHLRALFGSGLPFTPPIAGPSEGGLTVQVPGPRNKGRFIEYKRLDMGVTKNIAVFEGKRHSDVKLQLTAEILNVFDMVNTVAYTWIPSGGATSSTWNRVPTRLTPRTLNARLRLEF